MEISEFGLMAIIISVAVMSAFVSWLLITFIEQKNKFESARGVGEVVVSKYTGCAYEVLKRETEVKKND